MLNLKPQQYYRGRVQVLLLVGDHPNVAALVETYEDAENVRPRRFDRRAAHATAAHAIPGPCFLCSKALYPWSVAYAQHSALVLRLCRAGGGELFGATQM